MVWHGDLLSWSKQLYNKSSGWKLEMPQCRIRPRIIVWKVHQMLCSLSSRIHLFPKRDALAEASINARKLLSAQSRRSGWNSLPTSGEMWPQDCYLGSYPTSTKRNQRKGTALLVSDYINLSDNGTSFLCLIKIWNSGCDLSFLYYSLPPGSRSQWWRCHNL